ncbi:MAG: sugar phosphate isomerase/epimerase [bacterium]|nr:sugar phosphate isomerase/epimerase [bacterium]
MFKNLNCDLLGISGRQSEIIELALTYGFRGIDIDINDLVKRCERTSFESASRFLTSSRLNVGSFEAPVDLDTDDDNFAKQFGQLENVAEIAARAGAKTVVLNVPSQTDRLPYPEYFDVIRSRIDRVADVFNKEDIQVAIAFSPLLDAETKQFKFIQDVDGFVALANSCKKTGIVFDSWTWFCGKGTVEQLEQLGLNRVYVVRLGDCESGVAPEQATENNCLLPGSTGMIDNVAFLQKFVDADLDLPVSARGRQTDATVKRDEFIGSTQDALNDIFVQAGLPSQVRKPEMFAESSYASTSS